MFFQCFFNENIDFFIGPKVRFTTTIRTYLRPYINNPLKESSRRDKFLSPKKHPRSNPSPGVPDHCNLGKRR